MFILSLKKRESFERKSLGDYMRKNILVVDDSALMRRVECDIINSDSNLEATDYCRDGLEAYEKLKSKSYDGVVLDVNMPRMDGLQLLERLQKEGIKAKVVMVSSYTKKNSDITAAAKERGAIDFVTKPGNIIEAKGDEFKQYFLSVINSAFLRKTTVAPKTATVMPKVGAGKSLGRNKLIALACSTGGPKSLQQVIPSLPRNLDAPMILVQHMPVGFTKPMAERLNELSKVRVKEAEDGEKLEKGCVYVAPGGLHMEVACTPDGGHRIVLNDSIPAIGGLKPCANVTFDSLAKTAYDTVVCVVLTGMGADGTNGILSLARSKNVYVIAQDEESSIVYGMPKAIAETGIVDEIVPLDEVAKTITKNVGVK